MNTTARSLDHFVIAVRDVEAAGSAYGRLGFHALPRARHIEIGTSNRVIQLRDTYLELVGDLEKSPPLLRERMLPRFSCGEGLAIVSLTSSDLTADHRRIADSGLTPDRILNARRKITMPSGAEDETDSRCFYVWRPDRIFSTLFFSEHRRPETIWAPEYQRHPSTALRVTALIYLSDDPPREVDYATHLLGVRPTHARRPRPRAVRYSPRGSSRILKPCTAHRALRGARSSSLRVSARVGRRTSPPGRRPRGMRLPADTQRLTDITPGWSNRRASLKRLWRSTGIPRLTDRALSAWRCRSGDGGCLAFSIATGGRLRPTISS
jgi:hypothetical protein